MRVLVVTVRKRDLRPLSQYDNVTRWGCRAIHSGPQCKAAVAAVAVTHYDVRKNGQIESRLMERGLCHDHAVDWLLGGFAAVN